MALTRPRLQLSVRTRLTCWFIAVAVASASVGFYAVSSTSGDLDNISDDTAALYEISQVRTTYTQMRMELMIIVLAVVGEDAGAGFLLDDAVARQGAYDAQVDVHLDAWKELTTIGDEAIAEVDQAIAEHRSVVYDIALPLARGGQPTLPPPAGQEQWDVGSTLVLSNLRYGALSDLLVETAEWEHEHFENDAAAAQATADRTRSLVLFGGLAAIVLAGLIGASIARRFAASLRAVIGVLDSVRARDFTARVPVKGTDEFGRLGKGLNETVETLAQQATDLEDTTNELADASTALTHVSDGLSQNAAEVSSRTGEVSISVQAMSSHASSVSTAIEQMNESIREIAGRAAQATATSRNGTIEARNAAEAVNSLEGATAAIQRAVSAIGSIAEQTNLLALNATIESARAGEAGRGFAVVASEVQALAKETARATQEIESAVTQVGASVDHAVASMQRVEELINDVDSTQVVIAAAVEEQTATASEMAQAVGIVAANVQDVERALVAVTSSADQTEQGTALTRERAARLAELAESLRADAPAKKRASSTSQPNAAHQQLDQFTAPLVNA